MGTVENASSQVTDATLGRCQFLRCPCDGDDVGALLGVGDRNASPNASPAAGDQSNVVFQQHDALSTPSRKLLRTSDSPLLDLSRDR